MLPQGILGTIKHHRLWSPPPRCRLWPLVGSLVIGIHEVVELCIWLCLRLGLRNGCALQLRPSVDRGSGGHWLKSILIQGHLLSVSDVSGQAKLSLLEFLLREHLGARNVRLATGAPTRGQARVTRAFFEFLHTIGIPEGVEGVLAAAISWRNIRYHSCL